MPQQRDLESTTRWVLVIGLQKSKLGNMKLTGRERERDAPGLGGCAFARMRGGAEAAGGGERRRRWGGDGLGPTESYSVLEDVGPLTL